MDWDPACKSNKPFPIPQVALFMVFITQQEAQYDPKLEQIHLREYKARVVRIRGISLISNSALYTLRGEEI